jgi:hypothetical protein
MYYTMEHFGNVDWSHRGSYMHKRHGVTPAEANGALADPSRVVFDPDPSSLSGLGVRVIGWNQATKRLLTILLLTQLGKVYGVNGWEASLVDRKRYTTGGR